MTYNILNTHTVRAVLQLEVHQCGEAVVHADSLLYGPEGRPSIPRPTSVRMWAMSLKRATVIYIRRYIYGAYSNART
jgi:hypothetical protein